MSARARHQPWFGLTEEECAARLAAAIERAQPRRTLWESDEWLCYAYEGNPLLTQWIHKGAQAEFERMCR